MRAQCLVVLLAACSPDSEPTFTIDVEVNTREGLVVTVGDVVVGQGAPGESTGVATFELASGEELADFSAEAVVDYGTEERTVPLRSVCREAGKVIAAEHQQLYVWREAMDCELYVHSAMCEYTDGSTGRWGYKPCE
jgi:hypothetical protein